MKHKKFLAYAMLPVLSMGLFMALPAAAHGMFGMGGNATPEEIASRHQSLFQEQAGLIGATVDEVKNAWADGKNFIDLAKEKGVTEEQLKTKMQAARTAQLKAQLKTLVDKGIITQAQADKRLTALQNKAEKMHGQMGKRMMRGLRGMQF